MKESTTWPEQSAQNQANQKILDPNSIVQLCKEILDDLRLAAKVDHALWSTGQAVLRVLEVRVEASIVQLRGRIPSHRLKKLAQAVALAVPGVKQVRNELEVIRLR